MYMRDMETGLINNYDDKEYKQYISMKQRIKIEKKLIKELEDLKLLFTELRKETQNGASSI